METENFAALDLNAEYQRTLKSVRIAATVLIVACAGWCWQQYYLIEPPLVVLENRVGSGPGPDLPQVGIVGEFSPALRGIAALAAGAAMAYLLIAGRTIFRVIYAAIVGAGTCAIVGQLFSTSAMEAWHEIARILTRAR